MTKRRLFKIIVLRPIALILAVLIILHIYFRLGSHDITISKETTRILGPVNDDGTVDYIAYMNAEHSKGVTKENNAAIPLLEILGPTYLPTDDGAKMICEILGIDVPAEDDKQFTTLGDFRSEESDMYDNLQKAVKDPWAAEQYPAVAQWLKANQHALDATVIAVRRTGYYMPAVAPDDAEYPVATMSIPSVQAYVSMSHALCARAMLKLNSNQTADAWTDLITARRLARRVSSGYSVVEGLVAMAIEQVACQAIEATAGSGKLSEAQAKAFLDDLQRLGPLRDVADMIDEAERFMMLDSLLKTANKTKLPGWNKVLMNANAHYDSITAAFRQNTFKARTKAMDDHCRRTEEFFEKAGTRSFIGSLWRGFSDPAGATGDALMSVMLPALGRSMVLRDRATAKGELSVIAMALAAYRAEKKTYPDKLSELSPGYLKKVPDDLFVDKPFGYKQTDKGYLLYSVGENIRLDDREDDDVKDDIVVRVE
ncbi:MAG: hypothetical protein QGH60_21540 [Phycisphaerae bacterium]|nr:hypothetical protein [Phycisphaerae bacterium]